MQLTTLAPGTPIDRLMPSQLVRHFIDTAATAGRIADAACQLAGILTDPLSPLPRISEDDRPQALNSPDARPELCLQADFQQIRAAWPDLERLVRPLTAGIQQEYRRDALVGVLQCLLKTNPCYLQVFSDIYHLALCSGGAPRLHRVIEQIDLAWPAPACQLVFQHALQDIPAVVQRLERGLREGLPAILFNTMPKSGSMYIVNMLTTGLGVPLLPTALGAHPLGDRVLAAWTRGLMRGGAVSQEHIPANEQNLAALTAGGCDRIVIHVRDPRQCLLSNLHHFVNRRAEIEAVMEPFLPADFWDLPFASQADWMIDHYYPELVRWVEDWCAVADGRRPGPSVCFTRYEDLHGHEDIIVRSIFDFHELAADRFDHGTRIEKSEKTHFRKGLKNEWREAFTSAQKDRLNAVLDGALCDRFGWPRE